MFNFLAPLCRNIALHAAIVLAGTILGAAPGLADGIRVGVLAVQGAERSAQEFEPTFAHLEKRLAPHHFVLVPLDLPGMERAIADKSVAFVITNPGNYVELEERFGVTRLATLETHTFSAPTDTIGSTVIALNTPTAPKTLEGLARRRLAIVSSLAFGGYQVIWREMDDLGFSPKRLAGVVETGYPMELVIEYVRSGKADAGILRTCLLEDAVARGKARRDEFVVIGDRETPGYPCRASSRLYPDWPFAKLASTPTDLAKAVTAQLLTMPAVDGRAWTAPQDYTTVHALFRQLKIGPYAGLAHPSIRALLMQYWQWLIAIALAALWWVVHVVHVESLVRRRTQELEREIQEREKAEREARSQREQRDQFSRLGILGEMASNIAHELNQPLAAITNYAAGMTRMLDSGHADSTLLRDGARGVVGQAERAASIIQRIRSFVHRREARREIIDPNEVINDTVALFEELAAPRGIALRVFPGKDVPNVLADRIEIEQVLLNLLQNAVDAMLDMRDPAAAAKGITIRSSRSGADVKIALRDHGPGLTPDVEAHLFETFFTTKPQGLGLGLAICRTIVESHGGKLWAAANDDGGLTMRFTLPGTGE